MISAIDKEGEIYISLTQVNSESEIISLFLLHLVNKLKSQQRDWRNNTMFLSNGAYYHRSEETMRMMK